jgi:pantetheine-phosphate adenylyltransferase
MKAVYAGSFDPFTNGHLEIIQKASKIFDEIIVLLSENPQKKHRLDFYERKRMIEIACASNSKVKVDCSTTELVVDYCKKQDIHWLIRGIRSTSDYLYEENISTINKEIAPDIETIYFRADSNISSTMVWELYKHGKNIDKYVPVGVLNHI